MTTTTAPTFAETAFGLGEQIARRFPAPTLLAELARECQLSDDQLLQIALGGSANGVLTDFALAVFHERHGLHARGTCEACNLQAIEELLAFSVREGVPEPAPRFAVVDVRGLAA